MVEEIGSVGSKSFFVRQYEKASAADAPSGFQETLGKLSEQYGTIQAQSTSAAESILTGSAIDSHDVMIAAQEANLAFDLILEVRNKLIEAYQEIIRMQV